MPIYLYQNQETGEIKEVFQSMKDVHEYFGEHGDEDGWKRVFTVPQASVDSHIDPFSASDFAKKTGGKKGTYGDLLDASAELSSKRAEANGGVDPVKQQYLENYSKERGGKKHHSELPKKIETKNATIEF
jgi:predicted nucleic acid-binding Zn ribbon protein